MREREKERERAILLFRKEGGREINVGGGTAGRATASSREKAKQRVRPFKGAKKEGVFLVSSSCEVSSSCV